MSKKCIKLESLSAKEQELYNRLNENPNLPDFAGEVAMAYGAKDDLNGFLDEEEKTSRVNSIVLDCIRLMENQNESVAELSGMDSEGRLNALKGVLNVVRKNYAKRLNSFVEMFEKGENQKQIDTGLYRATRMLILLQNFDKLSEEAVLKIEKLSAIADTEIIEDELGEAESSDTDGDRIYDRSFDQESVVMKADKKIKLYLETRPKLVFKQDGSLAYQLNDLGLPEFQQADWLKTTLLEVLADSYDIKDMLAKLQQSEIPELQSVRNDLLNRGPIKPLLVEEGGVTYQVYNFQNAFFSAFNNTSYDFKQVLVTDVTNKEGNKVKKVMVFSPSKGGAVRGILKRWKGVKSAYKKEALRSNAQQVKDYLGKMDEKDPKQLFTVLKSAAKLVGGDITAKTWKSLTVGKKMDEIQKMIFGQSGSVTQLLDTILDNKDPFVEDSTLLRQLAKAELLANRGSSTGSFIDPKGNLRYPVNYHTAKTRIINELNDNKGRAVDPEHSIFDDPVLGKLEIMKWWDNDKSRIELSVFTALSDRNNDIDYSELDPVTSMATRLNLFMNPDFQGRDNKNKAIIFTMTPADRTGTRMLTVPKLSGTTIGLHGASANIETHAASIIEAELERIKLVEKENKENPEVAVKGYHKNGTSFQVFPWMNGILERRRQENNGVTPAIFDITEDQELMDEFMSGLIDVVADDFNHMIEEGFLEGFPGDKKRVPDVQLNDNIKKYFPGMEGLSNVEFKQKILDMLMTYYLVGTQISMITEGDISYFKNLTDASKRAGLSDTPGRTLRIGVGGANRTYKVALCNEMVSASEFADEYEKFIGKDKADFYRNLEISDGSGFCSLNRYADIMKGLGKYTPEMHRTIMELKKENPDFSKITEVLQPIKGFSHGNRYSEAHGRYMHKNQKYALMPLYKHMAKGDERLTNIVNKMESEGVDELIFGSATKLGGFQFNDVEQENAWALTEYSNEDFRIPTDFTYKEKLEDNDGSQFRKLQIGNIDPDTEYVVDGKTITGEEWVAEHEDIISNNIMQSNRELLTALVDNQGDYSIEKISKLLKKKLEGGSFEATSSELQDALDLVEFVYNNNERIRDTKIPLTFPTISDKVSKAILSLFQKEVVKQKVPGMSVLQQAAIGDQKLKFVRLSEDGKTVYPAQVQVTPQYFVKGLKMTLKSLKRKLTKSSDPKEIAELTESIKELSQVITDVRAGKGLDNIPVELRKVIAYRIPTQARNSSVPCIITEFLPITSGTAMVLPAELVAQSGADYDGDKLFLQMKTYGFDTKSNKIRTIKSENNTEVSKRGRSKRSNRLFDLRYSMLTNPAHFTELITPNHADTLREVLAKEDTTKTPADSFWGSLKMQDTLRSRNQAGGKMIGISSIANTFHALMQHMKSSYSQSANTIFNGMVSNNLGNKFNNKRSIPIYLSRTSSLGYNSAAPLNVAVQNKKSSNVKFLDSVALQVIASKKSLKGKSAKKISRFYTKFFKEAFVDALNNNLTEAELIELANTGNAVLKESEMNTIVAGYYEALMYIRSNMYSNAVDGVYETVVGGPIQVPTSKKEDTKVRPVYDTLPSYRGDTKTIAVVGSRGIPEKFAKELGTKVSELSESGFTVNTGDAVGTDAVARSNAESVNVFSPSDATDKTREIAKEIHPIGKNLKGNTLDLQARNTFQVFGKNLDTPVDFVLTYTPDRVTSHLQRTQKTGGTGQAIELASRKGIPVINVADPNWETELELVLAGNLKGLEQFREGTSKKALEVAQPVRIPVKTDYYNEELISDEFMQEQTASVDNAKEPLLGGLNINEYTAAAYTFLLEAGLGSRYSAELTRSKPVKDLVAEAKLEVLKGTDPRNAIDAAYTSIVNSSRYSDQIYKLDELTFSDADITLEELETLDRSQHLMALRTFMKAHKLGSAYTSEVQAKLHDTKGVKSDLAKAVGRATTVGSTSVIPESLKDRDRSASDKLVNLYNKPGKNLSVDTYLQQGLEGALNVVNDLAIKDNVVGEGALIYNNYMQLLTSVYKAPTQNTLGFHKEEAVFATIADKDSPVKKYLTPEKELQMRFGQNSLARRVVKAQIAENNKLAKNANHQPNRFLMSLMAEIPAQQLGEHKVVFDNSVVSRGGSIDLKDELVKGFNDLFSNKETKMLAIDLFMYGIAVHGIGSKSYQSYMDYVPNDLYLKNIKKAGSVVDLFEKTVSEEEGGKEVDGSIEFSPTMNTIGGQMLNSMLAKHSKALKIVNIDMSFNTAVDAQLSLYNVFKSLDGLLVEKSSNGVPQIVRVQADNEAKSISFEYLTDFVENMSLWSNVNKELNSNSLEDLHKKLTASGIVKDNNDPSCGI